MKSFSKQPREVIDVEVSLRKFFAKFTGDEINTVEVSARALTEGASPLVIGPDGLPEHEVPGSNPLYCKVWIGGGSSGAVYVVTAFIGTSFGRKKEVDFQVRVLDT